MTVEKSTNTLDLAVVQEVLSRRLEQSDIDSLLSLLSTDDRGELLNKIKELLGHVSTLVAVAHQIHDTLDLDVILPRLLSIITEAVRADRSSLFLYDDRTDELYSRVAEGTGISEIRFPANTGIAGAVFQNREAAIIADAYADERFNQKIDQKTGYRTRNILCAPISNNGTTIGVLQALNKHKGDFTLNDLTLLQALGAQAASALANAQLYGRVEETRIEQNRLIELTMEISTELQLGALLSKIADVATDILHADRSTIFLHDEQTGELWSRVAQGMETTEIRFPDHLGLAGACFTASETINIPDPYADSRFNQEIDRKTGYRTHNILCMPILAKDGRSIGVMQVLNKRHGPFNVLDESRLGAFAAQVSIALENAHLFEEVLNARNYNESILHSLSNGVVTIDAKGRIIKVNEATERILNMESDSLVGKSVCETLGVANPWLAATMEKVQNTGEIDLNLDATIKRHHENPVSANVTTIPLMDIHDTTIGTMLVLEDIGKEKRLRNTMARYMTKEVADRLIEDGESNLGGQAQEVAILFSDIRGFTPMTERLGARETVTMLNDYFSQMVDVVFHHGGILDKYIGDAIMALFGAPFPTERDTDNAVAVANDMMRVLAIHNQFRYDQGNPPIRIGIGISTGEVIVGNIGSPRRMDYTVIGDSVNLASRLEAANKLYGTSILICENAASRLTDAVRLREIDLLCVKGKQQPISIHEVLDYHTLATQRLDRVLIDFERGLAAYRKREFSAALKYFEGVLNHHPDDGPARVYLTRCHKLVAKPPKEDWTPVLTLHSK